MKLFPDCMDCCICALADGGGCLAGIGDNDFYPATTEQIVERLRAGKYLSDKNKMIIELAKRGVTSPVKIINDKDQSTQTGCEYCRECDTKDLLNTMTKWSYKTDIKPGITATVDSCDTSMTIYAIADTYEPNFLEETININFCPMCGRDLRVKED